MKGKSMPYLSLLAMAGMISFDFIPSMKTGMSFEERDTKPKKELPIKGNRFVYPDGVIIFALNKKNADRKYNNLKRERNENV